MKTAAQAVAAVCFFLLAQAAAAEAVCVFSNVSGQVVVAYAGDGETEANCAARDDAAWLVGGVADLASHNSANALPPVGTPEFNQLVGMAILALVTAWGFGLLVRQVLNGR